MILIKQKLRSSDGATMIYALAALLVITIVSFMVINSATVNVGRVKGTQTQQQAYLTVSSAASLVKQAVEDERIELELVSQDGAGFTVNSYRYDEDTNAYSLTELNPTTGNLSARGDSYDPFDTLLAHWVDYTIQKAGEIGTIYTNGDPKQISETYKMEQVVGTDTTYVLATITMRLPESVTANDAESIMDLDPSERGFGLTILLQEADSSYNVKDGHEMTVSFDAKADLEEDRYFRYEADASGEEEEHETIVQTFSVTWINGRIEKGGTV